MEHGILGRQPDAFIKALDYSLSLLGGHGRRLGLVESGVSMRAAVIRKRRETLIELVNNLTDEQAFAGLL
jgi:hypothetical protein